VLQCTWDRCVTIAGKNKFNPTAGGNKIKMEAETCRENNNHNKNSL
jgi:hypothetical protein